MTRRARDSGFTLLEILAAVTIFLIALTFAFWTVSRSYDQSLDSSRARELRMLAEYRLGEMAVFERHYDQINGSDEGEFDDLPEELRERYQEFRWRIDLRDVTAFPGKTVDPNAPLLFDSATGGSTTTTDTSGTGTSGTEGTGKGESQVLRELILTVTAPSDEEGGDGDSIQIITYLPQVAQKAATPATGGGGNR